MKHPLWELQLIPSQRTTEKTQGLHSNDQNTVPVNFYRDIFPLLALAVREAFIKLLQHFWRLLSVRLLW